MNAHEATFRIRKHGYRFELFPVHSPLLGESYLVSRPPLTYMLKFSGFSDLTSCLGWREMLHRQGEEWEKPNARRSATEKTNKLSFKLLVVVAPIH